MIKIYPRGLPNLINVLMIAQEEGRWGPSRLMAPLSIEGFRLAALCPDSNPICHSSHCLLHFNLPTIQSWRKFVKILVEAFEKWHPRLIIPCDEQIVAVLHFIVRRKLSGKRIISDHLLQILLDSLGSPKYFDAMMLKSDTRELAAKLGILVPKGGRVSSQTEALHCANEIGYPVFVKKSFSWAGRGTIFCRTEAEVKSAYAFLNPPRSWVREIARTILGRQWYPATSSTEVQCAHLGDSVMFNVVAWKGQYLGGFFGMREKTTSTNGPSTIVKLTGNTVCEEIARTLVAAMGMTGFCAFDFIWDAAEKTAILLECNPRPNQVGHLGGMIGVGLCTVLAKACKGEFPPVNSPQGSVIVPLFPQEWLRDEESAVLLKETLDIPRNDTKLLHFMLNYNADKSSSYSRLGNF
jgi:Carbamoyl-phosphate synthase L chain, ATP binding domain